MVRMSGKGGMVRAPRCAGSEHGPREVARSCLDGARKSRGARIAVYRNSGWWLAVTPVGRPLRRRRIRTSVLDFRSLDGTPRSDGGARRTGGGFCSGRWSTPVVLLVHNFSRTRRFLRGLISYSSRRNGMIWTRDGAIRSVRPVAGDVQGYDGSLAPR